VESLASADVALGDRALRQLVSEIQSSGRGRPYDSVLGVSGGVDSTFTAYQAKQLGLRPLIVHVDNGWNSELAVHNIEHVCRRLGLDLLTHVIDWDEFRDLHLAYLRASVIDVEVPTDHAITAFTIQTAAGLGLKYLLTGVNHATESVLPREWVWDKMDLLNLTSIHRRFGSVRLRTFPRLGFFRYVWYQQVRKIRMVELLDYLRYDKEEAKRVIERELGWRDYGGKHHESVFTRFYQGYILPRKFGVDKRRAHLSSLILSGQMSRQVALAELARPIYDPEKLAEDRAFVLKKLGLTDSEFEGLMSADPVPHDQFPNYRSRHYRYHAAFFRKIRPLTRLVRRVIPG
jgi:N-acetyl sugar amidotransferase